MFFFSGAGKDQKARAGSGAGEGSGKVWRVDMKEGGGEGKMGRGQWGGGGGTEEGKMGKGQQVGGEGEGRGGGDSEVDDWEGEMGIEGPKGREGKGGQAHRMLGGIRLQFFCDFVYPCNAGGLTG